MAQKYIDESGDKKYFTIIPNYIANHSTANDQSLYFQMKRLAGDGGICEAGYRYFIKQMGIGRKAFQKSRKYLLSKKWISYIGKKKVLTPSGQQMVNCYKVNDIWKLNNDHYQGGVKRNHLKNKVGLKEHEVGSKENKVGLKERIRRTRKIKKDTDVYIFETIKKYYQERINKNSSLTDKAKDKIKTRLKTFTPKQLATAIYNFSKNSWQMEHNYHRGIAWFYHSDERIEQYINLKEDTRCRV